MGDFDCQPKNDSNQCQCIAEEEERICVDKVDAIVWKFANGAIDPEAEGDGE